MWSPGGHWGPVGGEVPALVIGFPMSNGVQGGPNPRCGGCGVSPAPLGPGGLGSCSPGVGGAEPPTEWEPPFLPRELWVRNLLEPPPVPALKVVGPGVGSRAGWAGGWASGGCDRCDSLGTLCSARGWCQGTARVPRLLRATSQRTQRLSAGAAPGLGHPPGTIQAGAERIQEQPWEKNVVGERLDRPQLRNPPVLG